jgi:UDP-N-acetylmuramate dehydrogenase
VQTAERLTRAVSAKCEGFGKLNSMQIAENIALAPLTTFRVGGPARFFIRANSEAEVLQAVEWARERTQPLFVLGGGSNLLVADGGWPGLVLSIALRGISQKDAAGKTIFQASAGEEWDSFVSRTVAENCGGLECLSGIPGSVGGTPVQNVGAYGQEVAESITQVRVLDLEQNAVRELENRDSGFAYRTSIFNTTARGRHIVLSVSYALTPGAPPHLAYADLKKHFAGRSATATLTETRDAVRQIRRSKAMLLVEGDADCRSAGSFFKNPVISDSEYEAICRRPAARGEAAPQFPAKDGRVKVSAAWLVEHAGFTRGYAQGCVGLSHKHALAIVNRGGAKAADIVALKDEIQRRVMDAFGIALQPEPVFVGFGVAAGS